MKRGSRAWWIYYVVFWPTWLLLLLGGTVLLEWASRARGREERWEAWVRQFMPSLIVWLAHMLARGACRAAGISRDTRTIRVLRRVEAGEAPTPDPAPVSYSPYSPLVVRALVYVGLPLIIAMFAAGAVMGWREPDWMLFVLGILGTPFWIWMGTICWRERDHGDPEMTWRGPRDVWKGRDVPWATIEGGSIVEVRGVGGEIQTEHLRLEDASGRCVWAARIEKLPPDSRADLFAWLQTRAGLREPDAGA